MSNIVFGKYLASTYVSGLADGWTLCPRAAGQVAGSIYAHTHQPRPSTNTVSWICNFLCSSIFRHIFSSLTFSNTQSSLAFNFPVEHRSSFFLMENSWHDYARLQGFTQVLWRSWPHPPTLHNTFLFKRTACFHKPDQVHENISKLRCM